MRKLFLFLIAGVGLGLVWLVALRAGPPPAIAIEPGAKAIGRKTPITVRVAEPQRGLASIKVELVQGNLVQTIAEARHTPVPSWAIWNSWPARAISTGTQAMPMTWWRTGLYLQLVTRPTPRPARTTDDPSGGA